MWRSVCFVGVLAAFGPVLPCRGQDTALDSVLVSLFELDFAVPDAPAFELVDVSESHILRPSTVRQFTLAASEFADAVRDFQIPEAFAIEIAPFLLARGRRLGLSDYQRNPWLYRLRLSGATGRDSLQHRTAALGLRITLIDEGDLRTNASYIQEATAYTREIVDLFGAERDARRAAGEAPDPLDPIDSFADLTGERRLAADSIVEARAERTRRVWEERRWNARVLDLAFASRLGAADVLGNGLRVVGYAAWSTYGTGFGDWGQLLLGIRGALERDVFEDDFVSSGSLGARFYIGSNRYKGFTEAQFTLYNGDRQESFFLNAGGEVRLIEAVWASFSAGVDWTGDDERDPRLVSRFAMKLALPDLAE